MLNKSSSSKNYISIKIFVVSGGVGVGVFKFLCRSRALELEESVELIF